MHFINWLQTFLSELMDQQFKVLHPLSSFQRRSFSLSLLQLMASIFDEPNSSSASNPTSSFSEETPTSIPPIFYFPSAISASQAQCLLDGLQDPFDANRSVCLELLLKLPEEMIGFAVRKSLKKASWLIAFLSLRGCSSTLSTPLICHCCSQSSSLFLLRRAWRL